MTSLSPATAALAKEDNKTITSFPGDARFDLTTVEGSVPHLTPQSFKSQWKDVMSNHATYTDDLKRPAGLPGRRRTNYDKTREEKAAFLSSTFHITVTLDFSRRLFQNTKESRATIAASKKFLAWPFLPSELAGHRSVSIRDTQSTSILCLDLSQVRFDNEGSIDLAALQLELAFPRSGRRMPLPTGGPQADLVSALTQWQAILQLEQAQPPPPPPPSSPLTQGPHSTAPVVPNHLGQQEQHQHHSGLHASPVLPPFPGIVPQQIGQEGLHYQRGASNTPGSSADLAPVVPERMGQLQQYYQPEASSIDAGYYPPFDPFPEQMGQYQQQHVPAARDRYFPSPGLNVQPQFVDNQQQSIAVQFYDMTMSMSCGLRTGQTNQQATDDFVEMMYTYY